MIIITCGGQEGLYWEVTQISCARRIQRDAYNVFIYFACFWRIMNDFSHKHLHTRCKKLFLSAYCFCYCAQQEGHVTTYLDVYESDII